MSTPPNPHRITWAEWGILAVVFFVVALALFGCVSLTILPTALPLPEAPDLTFQSFQGMICVSEADANTLNHYWQEMAEFRKAWQRLSE